MRLSCACSTTEVRRMLGAKTIARAPDDIRLVSSCCATLCVNNIIYVNVFQLINNSSSCNQLRASLSGLAITGYNQGGDASVIWLKPKIKPRPLQASVVNKLFRPMPSTNGSGAGATICTGLNNLFFTAGRLLLNNARNGCGLMVK